MLLESVISDAIAVSRSGSASTCTILPSRTIGTLNGGFKKGLGFKEFESDKRTTGGIEVSTNDKEESGQE
jgi:hypothetical protein